MCLRSKIRLSVYSLNEADIYSASVILRHRKVACNICCDVTRMTQTIKLLSVVQLLRRGINPILTSLI